MGAFWGVWAGAIPSIRDQAGTSDGELGVALLFLGIGALPAMMAAGKALDRWGQRTTAAALVLLGLSGVTVAMTSHGAISLSIGLIILGAASGAVNVGVNTAAVAAERALNRSIVARAHGIFSTMLVAAILVTAVLFSVHAPLVTPFVLLALVALLVAVKIFRHAIESLQVSKTGVAPEFPMKRRPLVVIGFLGAATFIIEGTHQAWGAVYLTDELHSGRTLALVAPALFYTVVALTRMGLSLVSIQRPSQTFIVGAGVASFGTAVFALAPIIPIALVGLIVAASGTAIMFPMLLTIVAKHVDDHARGSATALVTSAAYLGFLAGPAYVGGWASATNLRGALLAVAVLAATLSAVALPVLKLVQGGSQFWGLRARENSAE